MLSKATLTPSGFRCLIRSRFVGATPDVRVLLRSWPLIFLPVSARQLFAASL